VSIQSIIDHYISEETIEPYNENGYF